MTLTSKSGELVRFLCFPEAVDVKPGYSLRSGLGLPGPDSSPDGCCMDGVSDRLGGSEGSPLSEDEGDADEGDSLEELEADALAEVGTGAGGATLGWFWKTRMASRTATAAISSIRRKEVSRLSHPARSRRPGQGSGHIRHVPVCAFCHQCRWKSGPAGEPSCGVCTRSTAASIRWAVGNSLGGPEKARATQGASGR